MGYKYKVIMKKFIGTKVIMAEPMTMTEAQKVLGREIKPATDDEDGYLVEYDNGYIHIISETIVAVCDGNFFPCVFKDSEDILATDWEEVER